MRTVISQSVVLPAPAKSLFAMYTDPAKHAAITGAPVAIGVQPGSPFQAFDGALTGATLQIIPTMVQAASAAGRLQTGPAGQPFLNGCPGRPATFTRML